ncbi:MAG: YqaE/Pmp3 family membrane protein [Planctomycetaceae bacterium]|nr:YqaE/Pmp3 family membrane protein [Planctomycetaceae bacterium]
MGKPKKVTRGSFFIEILLWLFFLLPGLIYSIWRLSSRSVVCRSCGSPNLVPLDSPVGMQLVKQHYNPSDEQLKELRSACAK